MGRDTDGGWRPLEYLTASFKRIWRFFETMILGPVFQTMIGFLGNGSKNQKIVQTNKIDLMYDYAAKMWIDRVSLVWKGRATYVDLNALHFNHGTDRAYKQLSELIVEIGFNPWTMFGHNEEGITVLSCQKEKEHVCQEVRDFYKGTWYDVTDS